MKRLGKSRIVKHKKWNYNETYLSSNLQEKKAKVRKKAKIAKASKKANRKKK